jgi:hypothetical protein
LEGKEGSSAQNRQFQSAAFPVFSLFRAGTVGFFYTWRQRKSVIEQVADFMMVALSGTFDAYGIE